MNTFAKAIIALALLITAAAPSKAQISSVPDFEARSAISDAGQVATQVRRLRNVPSIGIISIGSGFASPFSKVGGEINTLEIFAERNQAAISRLRRALVANPVTRRVLAEHNVQIGRVIGVAIGPTGSLRVFEL